MHVETYLHNLLNPSIHKSRIHSLVPVITAIIMTKQLKLSQLGRGLNTPGKERAGIRRVDRLLANTFYQNENVAVYKQITQCVVGAKIRPLILVDWSSLPNSQRTSEDGEHCVLRATLAAEGRSITLYDEVHSKKKEGESTVHASFLKKLASMLSKDCRPIIITDAGFKNPWFKSVLSLGWDYIGRIRGEVYYDEGNGFNHKISHLFSKARATAKSVGKITLAKTNPHTTNLYLYKHTLKGRKKLNKNGSVARDKDSKKYSSGYRNPWLLVSSIANSYTAAKRIVKMYKLRMTIEENFRDVKSEEYGFSMNENQTIKSARYIVWLMLSALASLLAWIVGYAAEQKNLHYDFQANTYRHKRVLSFFYLGCQVIRKKINIPIDLKAIQAIAWNVTCD